MIYLPLANILHHSLRSVLSALGIGVGVCMLIALAGLASGTVGEVADRWESVDADLIVFPRGWGDNAVNKSGSALSDKLVSLILASHGDIVERAVPVFTDNVKFGRQNQMVAGVDPHQWDMLSGGRRLSAGRLFDRDNRFAAWIEQQLLTERAEELSIEPADLSSPQHNGLEIVIDERLAAVEGYRVGDVVSGANHQWTVTGIVPAGAMTRVFMPRRTAQYLFGSGNISRSTLIFIKLKRGVNAGPAARAIEATVENDVKGISEYRGMLLRTWKMMFTYINIVNGIAVAIAFLFTMITLYTMVLQQRREIAILKSCGAGWAFILRQVLGEAMLLAAGGAIIGIALSFAVKLAIERFLPLMTITITWQWIAIALVAAAAGAAISALYPAWRAARVDMIEALALE
ncbi:MAG: ABC transporter permease [Planctomycetaceae bacterium]|nr:ABC transporter permease [Planctomycetaceae bacterium]